LCLCVVTLKPTVVFFLFPFIGNVFRHRSLDVTMYYNFVNVNQSKKSGIKKCELVHELVHLLNTLNVTSFYIFSFF
jgi:hypothetical protein